MSNPRIQDFMNHLVNLRKNHPLDTTGHLIPLGVKQPDQKMKCNFYMVTCTADKVRENDFREFLSTQIIRYVIKSKFLDPKKLTDEAYIASLYRRAKRQFMKKSPTAAECGELILFVLLESKGTLQILQNMPLKTHREMAFHGSDGVYIEIDNNLIVLHFGESKMVGTLEAGISDAVKSITSFYNEEDDDEEHEIELDLISTHIDEKKFGGFTDLIEELVLPYGKDHSKVREKSSIFIGYTWDGLSRKPADTTTLLTDYLKKEYTLLHDEIAGNILNAVKVSKIKDLFFDVHFIPFIDAVKFRTDFKRKL